MRVEISLKWILLSKTSHREPLEPVYYSEKAKRLDTRPEIPQDLCVSSVTDQPAPDLLKAWES